MSEEADREDRLVRAVAEIVEVIEAGWDWQGLSAEKRKELVDALCLTAERLKRRCE